MDITSFDQWLDTLTTALRGAKASGMTEEQIRKSAVEFGDMLANNVNPDAPENRLLKTLWENGDEKEKQALASMVIKMVEKNRTH
ncbi:MAG: DUF3243 family protein [Bacillota bacterium]